MNKGGAQNKPKQRNNRNKGCTKSKESHRKGTQGNETNKSECTYKTKQETQREHIK